MGWKLSWDLFFIFLSIVKTSKWSPDVPGREQKVAIVTLVYSSKSHIHGINLMTSPCKFIHRGLKSITLLQVKCVRRGKIDSVICFQLCKMLPCGCKWTISSGPSFLLIMFLFADGVQTFLLTDPHGPLRVSKMWRGQTDKSFRALQKEELGVR